MSADKLPLTVENVMAEKDKVAAAVLRGESYDPFGVAEMFEPAAAAEAINAVVGAPAGSASSGLEVQPGVELDTKDVEMTQVKLDEGRLLTTSDKHSPKSSEPDWELADAELVGDLLLSQEEDDRQQFVFLSEWDKEEKEQTMGQVKIQLDELTQHIQALSVGGSSGDDHGPQPDEHPLVAVEPAGDGFFKLTCFPEPFPHVSRTVASLLTGLKVKEVAQLFDLFQGKPLTRAGVERALECYVVTKRSKDHENLLKRSYNKTKTKFGIGYAEMDKAKAGDPMEWICPQCLVPRPQTQITCLMCRSKDPPVHRSEPTARMVVDGVEWTLRFDDEGTHHWGGTRNLGGGEGGSLH